MDKLYHDAKKEYEIENDTINSTRETIIIGVFVKTLNVSTGLGLLTAAESAIINYINKKTTKTKTQTKARVSVQRGKVVYKKNVKIAYSR